MATTKKDDSIKKAEHTTLMPKSGTSTSNSPDNKRSGNPKDSRTAETKADADKKSTSDNKNPRNK
ncbi:MAG: hypothetical protein IPL52_15170 [Flavobacteriales bacterium]|nr:hypothetical protein [Flavobacteriales bacterium]